MRALAEAAGIKSVAFVSDVERGFRNPSVEVLAGLAQALDQSLDALRRYDNRPPVPELRKLTEQDSNWATALRRLVEEANAGLTPEMLIRLLENRNLPTPRTVKRATPHESESPELFG